MGDRFKYDVFLSHNSADKPRVRRLAEKLRAAGLAVWLDEWVIRPGDDIYLAVERGLEESRTLVLCLSKAALGSGWVSLERSTVLFRDPTNEGRRFIPLLMENCELPDTLRRYRYVDWREETEESTTELVQACLIRDALPRDFPRQTPFFRGRDREIDGIHNTLRSKTSGCAVLAIHGISGSGKTQLAIGYARKYAAEYDLIAFFRAEEPTTLEIDYANLSTRFWMNAGGNTDPHSRRRWIREELARRGNWLLIFDNVTQFDAIEQYIPSAGKGHILITSQNAHWGDHGESLLELGSLETVDAMDLVRTICGADHGPAISTLVQALGNLALALSQAAAYCRSTGDTVSHYVAMLQTEPITVLEASQDAIARRRVTQTWKLAFDRIKATNLAAIQFLKICSFLAPDDVPLDAMIPARHLNSMDVTDWRSKVTSIPEPVQSALLDPIAFGQIVQTLMGFSLVSVASQRLSMHRLLQRVVRHTAFTGREIGPRSAIELITAKLPLDFAGGESHIHRRPDIVPHAVAAIEHALDRGEERPAEVLFLAERRDMAGDFEKAIGLARRVLRTAATTNIDAQVSATVRLAGFLDHDGRSAEAVPMLHALRQRLEDTRAPGYLSGELEHKYWWGLYQLGVNEREIRQYSQAQETLAKVYSEAPSGGMRLSARHQLGVIDLLLGNLDSAEKRFKKCLSRRGPRDTDHRRAFEFRRLGQVSALRGQFDIAVGHFREAIQISQDNRSQRYVDEATTDIKTFVDIPRELLTGDRPRRIVLRKLSSEREVPESRLFDAFRVLNAAKRGYLAEVDSATGSPTGDLVDFAEVHREGVWHATVAIGVFSASGSLAIQRRGEQQSIGKWDVTVGGHIDVGEQDTDAAVREIFEEVGILVCSDRLVRIGGAYSYSKRGCPETNNDHHTSHTHFEYCSDQSNCERISVFRLTLKEGEQLRPSPTGAAEIRWLIMHEAIKECERNPNSFASSFKHLFCHEGSPTSWFGRGPMA